MRGPLTEALARASRPSSRCHDGFHLISGEWKLTHTTIIWLPRFQILQLKDGITKECRGARYVSHWSLGGVDCIGVMSTEEGVAIFETCKIELISLRKLKMGLTYLECSLCY